MPRLLDTRMIPHELYRDILCLSSAVSFFVGLCGYRRFPLGLILSIRETQEWLPGLENVPRAHIQVLSSKWMKYQFWVNYPLTLPLERETNAHKLCILFHEKYFVVFY